MNPNLNTNPNRSGPLYVGRLQKRKSDASANPPNLKPHAKNVDGARKTWDEFTAANSQLTNSDNAPRDGAKPKGSQKGSLDTSLASSRNKDREEPKLVQFKDRRSAPHSKEPIRPRLQRSPGAMGTRSSDMKGKSPKTSLAGTPRSARRGESQSPTDARGSSTPDGSPGRAKRLKRFLTLSSPNTSPRGRTLSKANAEPGGQEQLSPRDKAHPHLHPLSRTTSPPRSPQMYNRDFLDGLNAKIREPAEPLPKLPAEGSASAKQRLKTENDQLRERVENLEHELAAQSQRMKILLDENRRLKGQTLPPADQTMT